MLRILIPHRWKRKFYNNSTESTTKFVFLLKGQIQKTHFMNKTSLWNDSIKNPYTKKGFWPKNNIPGTFGSRFGWILIFKQRSPST